MDFPPNAPAKATTTDLGNPQSIGFPSGRQVIKDHSGPGVGQSDCEDSDLSGIDSPQVDAGMRRAYRHNGEPITRCLLDQAHAGVVARSSQNLLEDDEGNDDRDIWPGTRSRSSSETRARWISGDALTTRIDRLFFLCLELLDACLDRAHVGLTKCIDELDTRQARGFGSLAL